MITHTIMNTEERRGGAKRFAFSKGVFYGYHITEGDDKYRDGKNYP